MKSVALPKVLKLPTDASALQSVALIDGHYDTVAGAYFERYLV